MNHSLTHLLTTSNQEMLAHLKSNVSKGWMLKMPNKTMIICNLESNRVHNKDDLPAQLPALKRVTWRRAVVAVSLCLDVTVVFVVIIIVFVVSHLITILL